MVIRKPRAGFTLIELLVVVAIIALLISILLPSLKEAREQGKKAVCLSNIRSIAQGTNAYASEDEMENAIPIHQNMVSTLMTNGLQPEWALRTVMPMSYGGRTANKPFQGSNVLMDQNGRWAARTRPLNTYIYDLEGSDEYNLPLYQCPSDQGYPDNPFIYDAPIADVANVPCYDILGNSFRFNFAGIVWLPYGGVGEFSVGPWGHRLSTLENTAKQTCIMEPQFYSMTIQAAVGPLPAELLLRGWHGSVMTSNVGFVDGSGRTTKAEELIDFDNDTLRKMGYSGSFGFTTFLRRGSDWQMDCYPTPGAFVPAFPPGGGRTIPSVYDGGWPFGGYQDNMRQPN